MYFVNFMIINKNNKEPTCEDSEELSKLSTCGTAVGIPTPHHQVTTRVVSQLSLWGNSTNTPASGTQPIFIRFLPKFLHPREFLALLWDLE